MALFHTVHSNNNVFSPHLNEVQFPLEGRHKLHTNKLHHITTKHNHLYVLHTISLTVCVLSTTALPSQFLLPLTFIIEMTS